MLRSGTILLAWLLLFACQPHHQPFPDPDSVQWTKLASGLNRPTDIRSTGDSLLITERFGLIRSFHAGRLMEQPLLDLRELVGAEQGEQGLLSLALDPQFRDNGVLYVYYTDRDGNSVLAEISLPPDGVPADPSALRQILSIEQPFPNHNGGGLAFGPDGYLYLGVGDGGGNGDPHRLAQRLDSLLGKILRIDVRRGPGYRIPADNPFREAVGALPEIWALGLRNPWRIAFDEETGDLFIADVGEFRYEEINWQPAGRGGLNFGWSDREGQHAFNDGQISDDYVDPVAEYGHSLGCAVTGGHIVRDARLPQWHGTYLYSDSCSGNMWGLEQERPGRWRSELLLQSGYNVSSFGTDEVGRMYLLDYDGSDSALYRLDPVQPWSSTQD